MENAAPPMHIATSSSTCVVRTTACGQQRHDWGRDGARAPCLHVQAEWGARW